MEDFKMAARPPFKFKGTVDRWPEWRDSTEGIFRAWKVWLAIQFPRPDAPFAPVPPAPVAPGASAGGEEKAEGGAAPGVPAAPLGPNLQEQWDDRSAKIYMYLQLYTDGIAKSVVSQFRATGNGVEAWAALNGRFDHQGMMGKAMLYRKIAQMVWTPTTDPEDFFLELERYSLRLEQLGEPFGEARILGTVLDKLPKSMYRPIVTMIDREADPTYDRVKEDLRVFYKRHIFDKESDQHRRDYGDKALAVDHQRQRRTTSKDSYEKWTKGAICHRCNKKGHVKKDCPMNDSEEKSSPAAAAAKPGVKKTSWRTTKSPGRNYPMKGGAPVKQVKFAEAEDHDEGTLFLVTEQEALKSSEIPDRKVVFVVDTGATSHMVTSSQGLTNVSYQEGEKVNVAGGSALTCIGRGTMRVNAIDAEGKSWLISITGVMIVPGLGVNLLSVSKLAEKGTKTSFDLRDPYLEATNGRRTSMVYSGGLYRWQVNICDQNVSAEAYVAGTPELWHRRLAHRSLDVIQDKGAAGIDLTRTGSEGKCSVCETSKSKRISFPKRTERDASEPFELVHIDLTGPIEEPSISGARYAAIYTDEYTRYVFAYCIEFKDSFITCLRKFMRDVKMLGHRVKEIWGLNEESQYKIWDVGKGVQGIRTDRGSEFINEDVRTFCGNAGIKHTFTGPYAPQQQGLSERRNRTLFDMVRAMLSQSNLTRDFWAEALNTAVYIVNRLPARGRASPHQMLYGRPPMLTNLRVFGCRAYVQYPRDRIKKLDSRAWEGILLGYDDSNWRCYRIYDPETATVRLAIHVRFDETLFPRPFKGEDAEQPTDDFIEILTPNTQLRRAEGTGDREAPQPVGDHEPIGGDNEPVGDVPPEANVGPPADVPVEANEEQGVAPMPILPRGVRLIEEPLVAPPEPPTLRRSVRIMEQQSALNVGELMGNPSSYKEAMRSPNKAGWVKAMTKEFDSLEKNDTWDLVQRPKDVPVIPCRWVFTMKCNNLGEPTTPKARHVVKGYSQVYGVNVFDTESPVTRPTSIRTVLSLTAMFDWDCINMDVDTAFLNAPVSETIYVEQPEGFEKKGPRGEELVCKLNKSLYGLKQAPRNWNMVIDQWFKENGFHVSPADPCMYIRHGGEKILIVLLWVDDLIICGNDREGIAWFKEAISKRFNMKDLGDLVWILGMEVHRDRLARTMRITQRAYINTLLKRFGMMECKPIGSPAEGDLLRDPSAKPDKEYMCLVGSLLYAAMITRPDIAYAVQAMGRHLQASNESHFAAGKRVLRYLQGTKELGLTYSSAGDGSIVEGYADSDWASDKDTRRSVTAYVYKLGGAAISWASRLQPTVALSSAESEYMAASAAAQEAVHLRSLLRSLGFEQKEPTIIWDDNQGCIAMAKNPTQHKRTKHIDIRFHFVREVVARGDIKLRYIGTEDQVADLLTKSVPKGTMQRLRPMLLGA